QDIINNNTQNVIQIPETSEKTEPIQNNITTRDNVIVKEEPMSNNVGPDKEGSEEQKSQDQQKDDTTGLGEGNDNKIANEGVKTDSSILTNPIFLFFLIVVLGGLALLVLKGIKK
ncbi:MAG: hypothetical protein QW465_03235, partial [Candidatus Anstonellales archaeon]